MHADFSGEKNPAYTHGMTGTRTYRIWCGMRTRCYNKMATGYENYGGRGVKICKRWATFSGFLADMGVCPEGHSLDRIKNDGDYKPSNCRWATKEQQVRNARSNINITIAGKTMCAAEWARIAGISAILMRYRFNSGWRGKRLLIPPTQRGNPHPVCPWK